MGYIQWRYKAIRSNDSIITTLTLIWLILKSFSWPVNFFLAEFSFCEGFIRITEEKKTRRKKPLASTKFRSNENLVWHFHRQYLIESDYYLTYYIDCGWWQSSLGRTQRNTQYAYATHFMLSMEKRSWPRWPVQRNR